MGEDPRKQGKPKFYTFYNYFRISKISLIQLSKKECHSENLIAIEHYSQSSIKTQKSVNPQTKFSKPIFSWY